MLTGVSYNGGRGLFGRRRLRHLHPLSRFFLHLPLLLLLPLSLSLLLFRLFLRLIPRLSRILYALLLNLFLLLHLLLLLLFLRRLLPLFLIHFPCPYPLLNRLLVACRLPCLRFAQSHCHRRPNCHHPYRYRYHPPYHHLCQRRQNLGTDLYRRRLARHQL